MSALMDCMDGHAGYVEVVVRISSLGRALGHRVSKCDLSRPVDRAVLATTDR